MTKRNGILMALGGLMMLGFAGGARADLHMTYHQQAAISPSGVSLRDIAVNKNVGSDYYGYVYAASVNGSKVHILRPARPEDGSGAASLVDTGLTISASAGSNLFGVAVGADDVVWLGIYGTGNVETAPPVPNGDETNVTAVKQFNIATSQIRGIAVTGTIDNARVWITTQAVAVQHFQGGADSWDQAGTFTHQWTTPIGSGSVPYGLGADSSGNVYAAVSENGAGAKALVKKIKLDGTFDTTFSALRPPFTTILNSNADAEVVEDARLPGGGYVYWSGRQVAGSLNRRLVHRYRLSDGAWLDSFGPAATTGFTPPDDATYTVLETENGAGNPYYFGADDKGNLYLNADSYLTLRKITASQPYLVAAGAKNSAGDVIKSSPTVVDGVAYFGANDGKLYAYNVADGSPAGENFPVDVAGLLEQPNEKILGRPAVYYADVDGSGPAKYIYFTTSGGFVCRLDADGGNLRFNVVPQNSGGVNATPAVTSDGIVYVGLYDGTAARVYRYNPGLTEWMESAALGYGNMTSVAVAGNNVFVGLSSGVSPKMAVLNAATLDVLNTVNGEQVSAPPYVNGGYMYYGTWSGNFYKVNAATGTMDETFGEDGAVDLGAKISASPFVPQNGPFLVPTDEGKVWVVPQSGLGSEVFFDTGEAESPIGGVVAFPDALGFGTAAGTFYVVPADIGPGATDNRVQVYRGHGAFSGAPAIDRGGDEDYDARRFVIASEDGNVYTFPRTGARYLPN